MSQVIETQVAEFLTSLFVTYEAHYAGLSKRDNWECDGWRITFKRGAQSFYKEINTDFFTGLGLRKKAGSGYLKTMLPKAPSAASVLHSLLSDASAIETSFDYWCSDYGYDSDSLKALNTYQACCEVGKKVNSFFSAAEREQLREMLQEY